MALYPLVAIRALPVLVALLASLLSLPAPPGALAGTTIHVPAGDVGVLRFAIGAANLEIGDTVGLDTIVLAPGAIYTLTEPLPVHLGLHPLGLPPITSAIRVVGNGATIQRDPSRPCLVDDRVDRDAELALFQVDETGHLTLEQVTLRHGCARFQSGAIDVRGGRIIDGRVRGGTVEIVDSTFSENASEFGGGAITIGTSGVVTVVGSLLTLNRAAGGGGSGGAILVSGGGHLQVVDSRLIRNTATGAGGAIYGGGRVDLIRSLLERNVAEFMGGGLYAVGDRLTVEASRLIDNHAGASGGAIAGNDVAIRRSTLADNAADEAGGAIYGPAAIDIGGPKIIRVEDSTLAGNRALEGGAAYVTDSHEFDEIEAVIRNTTLTNNRAAGGGALRVGPGAMADVVNVTLFDNKAGTGGGIHVGPSQSQPCPPSCLSSTVQLANAILVNPTGANCANSDPTRSVVFSRGHNLASDDTCNLTAPGDLPSTRAGLGTFRDDGEPGRGHYPLLITSPAIDGGDPRICSEEGLFTDQLGQLRRDPPCDIGAVEFLLGAQVIDLITSTSLFPGTVRLRLLALLRPAHPLIRAAINQSNDKAATRLLLNAARHVEDYAAAVVGLIQNKQGDPQLLASMLAQAKRVLVELDAQIAGLADANRPPQDGPPPPD